jgi:hypothetical protein
LEIPEGLHIEAMFPIGVDTKIKTTSRGKMKLDQVIYFDKWKEKKMVGMTKVSKSAI